MLSQKGKYLSVFMEKLLPLARLNSLISINVLFFQILRFALGTTLSNDVTITPQGFCEKTSEIGSQKIDRSPFL